MIERTHNYRRIKGLAPEWELVVSDKVYYLVEMNDDGAHKFEYRHVQVPVEKGFFEKMLFWRDNLGPDYSGAYRTRIQADGDESRVYLMLETGTPASTNAAEHVLGIFMERLG